MNKKYYVKLAVWLIVFLTLGIGIGRFVFTHNFHWQIPFKTPVIITDKVVSVHITQIVQADTNNSPLSPDQQYACNLFGKDCATAIAIMRAESANNHNAIGINAGSVDIGCMQINSSRLPKIDTNKINLLNCHDNIDVAYQIYKDWKGFGAWTAYNNGSYKKYLIN